MTGEIIWDTDSSLYPFHVASRLHCSLEARYERAFVDFFEDELVRRAYVWEDVVHHFLFSGDEPIFNSIIADRMLNCIHTSLCIRIIGLHASSWTPPHSSCICL